MKERWKPAKDNEYYMMDILQGDVCDYTWEDDLIDKANWEAGNCFRTEAEAQAAAEKVKALLLSLHEPATDCNQLPKLTAEVFNRPECPEWAKYAAVDSNGAGYYYSEKPFILSDAFGWGMVCSENNRSELISCEFNNSDWQNSLIERPAKLPEWCKVGAWVYYPEDMGHCIYLKISELKSGFVHAKAKDDYDHWQISYSSICEYGKPARLRPYNANEMRGVVGDVFEDKDGNLYMAVSYIPHGRGLLIGGFYFNAEELLDANFTLNGKPCGVFEHLENGEWVK